MTQYHMNNEFYETNKVFSSLCRISLSDSFYEAESKHFAYWASLTPELRISGFYELMMHFYTSKKPDWSNMRIVTHVVKDNKY